MNLIHLAIASVCISATAAHAQAPQTRAASSERIGPKTVEHPLPNGAKADFKRIPPLPAEVHQMLDGKVRANLAKAGEPVVSAVKVTFNTYDGGNDKDANSRIKLTLAADYGNGFIIKIAARDWETYGLFDDHNGGSIHSIELPVNGTLPVSAIGNAKFKIEFEADGDDTWKFHYALDLIFDNGMVLSREGRNKELSEHGVIEE
jgi:hypothetical protein